MKELTQRDIDRVVHALHLKGYDKFASGTTRDIFRSPSGRTVAKVPHLRFYWSYGRARDANIVEYENYLRYPGTIAHCKLVKMFDVPIIFMEYIDAVNDYMPTCATPPGWPRIDGCQSGYNRKGRLVMYDAGDPPSTDR